MRLAQQFVSFFLVLSLSSQGVVATELVPTNPPNTPAGVQCTGIDQNPGQNGVCCVGLQKNAGGVCDEPAYDDITLSSCVTDANCSGGTACLPQSRPHLFSGMAPVTEDPDRVEARRKILWAQLADVPEARKSGLSCVHARECGSYSCASGVCQEKKVCRYADRGEVAGSGVKCGGSLVKMPNGICQDPPESKNTVYIGLIEETTIAPIGKCEFRLDEDTQAKSLVAMRSLRAMEYFLATISVDQGQECFEVLPLLKTEIGQNLLAQRKTIIANFNQVLAEIESDYDKILAAGENYKLLLQKRDTGANESATNVTIHRDEKITMDDLGSRQSSGYDTLALMFRRNLLFQSYEAAMLKTLGDVGQKVEGLSKGMADWSDGAGSWNLGTTTVNAYNCDASKYRKRAFLSWQTRHYKTVKDRWAYHYEVTGNAPDNASVVSRPGVAGPLALIGGFEAENPQAAMSQAIEAFTKPTYFLVDPMLFAGVRHGELGVGKPLNKSSGFLGIFGGFKDERKAFYLRGEGSGSYVRLHAKIREQVEEFYRGLKDQAIQGQGESFSSQSLGVSSNLTIASGAPAKSKGFVYEPEIISTSAKDCLGENPQNCQTFGAFLDGVADEAFAHFLAYGYSDRDSYEGYFTNAQAYRRRLLAKLEVDVQNLSEYYSKVIDHRNKQNDCIKEVVGGLVKSGVLAEGSNGIQTGSTVEQQGNGNGNAVAATGGITGGGLQSNAVAFRPTTGPLERLTRSRFFFDLKATSPKSVTTSSLISTNDGRATDSTASVIEAGSGSVTAETISRLAVRRAAMTRANVTATKAGVKVEAKRKSANELIASMGASASGLAATSIGTRGNQRGGGFQFGGGTASVSPKEMLRESEGPTANSLPVPGAFTLPLGTGPTRGAGTAASSASATGVSAPSTSDNDKLLGAAEAEKEQYVGTEEDGIFKKVSKAYVRNLDRILHRKKKVESNDP